jgi:uncharacterized OsmC-like protein
MAEPAAKTVNGIEVDQLLGMIDVLKADSNLARMTLCSETEWVCGHHSKTKIQSLAGHGRETTFETRNFSGEGEAVSAALEGDHVSNALAVALATLSSCITTDFVFHAALRGIQLNSLQLRLEADIDLRGFLGLSNKIRPGYQSIQLSYRIKSDAPQRDLEELCEHVQKISPLLDVLRNPVPVTIEAEI